MSDAPLLAIDRLTIGFPSPGGGRHHPVDGISLRLDAGERLGIVGESGCGKSLTAMACLGLVPEPGCVIDGTVEFDGKTILGSSEADTTRVRGREIGLVLQEASDALNPVYTVGFQIMEALAVHSDQNDSCDRQAALDLLKRVAIDDPRAVFHSYPHELSGGLAQRVMLALALVGRPKILVADEPTASLDLVTRKTILELLDRLCREHALALVLISHDLTVVGEIVDRVLVMYEGQIVEEAPREALFSDRLHPYTRLLFDSVPGAAPGERLEKLVDTKGGESVPGPGCRFSLKCPIAEDHCRHTPPELVDIDATHRLRCPVMAARAGDSYAGR